MTGATEFLHAIWGVGADGKLDGVHYIAEPAHGGFTHHPVKTIAGALVKAREISDAGRNAYFACAEYLTAENRKAENAAGARAIWLDIDCGEAKAAAGKGYPTKHAAIKGLIEFCRATGLPEPNIVVDSGNGLHVYWYFTTLIPRDEWRVLAAKLKMLAVRYGLRADPSRTADIASVLRVPGTMNWKNPDSPKPVTLKRLGTLLDFAVFAEALDAASPEVMPVTGNPFAAALTVDYLPLLETPENILRVKAMLAAIPADCGRDDWLRVCWSVKATGWTCAENLAREWSQTAPDKYAERDFATVADGFDPDKGIGVGTLVHYAHAHGWKDIPGNPMITALTEMNARYFVARIGGGVFVCDEEDENILAGGMTFTAFRQLHAGRMVEGKNVAVAWLNWSERRTFSALVFDPSGRTSEGVFNTWRGLAVTPMAGACVLILSHIREILCSGKPAQFEYVIRWMALLVQRPWQKPEVALVLRSLEGSGKTILIQVLLHICGQHGFTAAQKDQVAGRFNGHLFDKLVVVLEEAFFAGDPAAVAATKALVTNQTIGYESKGKDSLSAPNYAHVISLTNNSWAVPAGEDSRRWMVLDVSDARRGDHAYFDALAAEIDNGGTEAFLAHLLCVDLTGWNPRALPASDALRAQQRETLMRTDPVAAWLYHVLAEGSFTVEGGAVDWAGEVAAIDVQDSYMRATARSRGAPTWDAAAKKLRGLMPPGSLGRARKTVNGGRSFFYSLPDLDSARKHFAEVKGVDPCAE